MRIRHVIAGAAAVSAAVASALVLPLTAGAAERTEYTVLAKAGVSEAAATAAIGSAGGEVVSGNDAVGMYRVATTEKDFAAQAAATDALLGA
ncbi:MAG: serine protease, partial [Micromonosporaceae bacterium]